MIHEMSHVMYQPDSELQVAGVHVSRSQFNALYYDVIDALNTLHERTGIRPVVYDLGRQAVVTHRERAGGRSSDVHIGQYLKKHKVAIKCLRDIQSIDDKAKKVRAFR
jgi:hypothetical protein